MEEEHEFNSEISIVKDTDSLYFTERVSVSFRTSSRGSVSRENATLRKMP